jgi:acyl dehydratase
MRIDYESLLSWDIPEVVQTITTKDCILYALGVGLGEDPVDAQQLRYVYEAGLEMLPTMTVTLCYPGQWHAATGTGIISSQVVQGAQSFFIHCAQLPIECTVVGKTKVTGVYDKGPGRGAIVTTECQVTNTENNELICTIGSTHFCRANGGFGGPNDSRDRTFKIPTRRPDARCELKTIPQAGLIYRLSGDRNPLHVDPEYAKRAGFIAPILHGRCTFGVVGHAILKEACNYKTSRLRAMTARFSSPVYPGETIATDMWRDGARYLFRARSKERDLIILDHGLAEVGS